jgi:hypothetical protein
MPEPRIQTESRASAFATAVTVLLLTAILFVGVYGFAHVSLRPVNPQQKPPTQHFGRDAKCRMCHPIDAKARLVEVR